MATSLVLVLVLVLILVLVLVLENGTFVGPEQAAVTSAAAAGRAEDERA